MKLPMDWFEYRKYLWGAFESIQQATLGRRLDVGGFVLADPPEAIFCHIGRDYIKAAWDNLCVVLKQHGIVIPDLLWGTLHPGETWVTETHSSDPCCYIGWTSQGIADLYEEPRWKVVDEALAACIPSLRCAFTWRSLQWRIPPEDIPFGIRLFEAYAIDEVTEWSPEVIFSVPRDLTEPWVRAAAAVRDRDQEALDGALAAAKTRYSPLGYRIVVHGFHGYASSWKLGLQFPLPLSEESPP